MKKVFTFKISQEIEVDEIETSKNEKGEEVKVTKKVKKKEPRTFFIKKPGRSLLDESELFYNGIYWKAIKDYNIQPAIQLQKRYLDDNGILSQEQKKEYSEINILFFEKQAKYQQLNSKTDKTIDEQKAVDDLLTETVDLLNRIQSFENQMGNQLYQNTAENIARNRTATWWMLQLSYEDKNGDFKSVFGDGDLNSRYKIYDKIEEDENPFQIEMVKKLLLAASLWYFNKAQNQEEFDLMLKMYENSESIEANEVVKEVIDSIKETVAPAS